ncbi:hypothetical protein AB0L64_27325 [Kribbella sp. NPDC051936]|uniref:hypothetical protein n=1 Tax=Kribbella sp. NPDC051936 TaxID=3154946 RepID=UPI0034346661
MTDVRPSSADPGWTIRHFSQSNPSGRGSGDVAALLRRVADTLDSLGDVQVEDLTFKSNVTAAEDELTITVYYDAEPRRR